MKIAVLAVLLPLALAWPQTWESWEKKEDPKDKMNELWEQFMQQHKKMQLEVEGTLTVGDKSWGDAQKHQAWGKQEDDMGDMMKMFQKFKEWHENMEEDKQKGEMMEKFEQWKKFRMMQEMKEWKEEMEQDKREKEMEALRHKQMMVQKVANITEQFKKQKAMLIYGVTSQFVEFCKCSDTSAMLKKFFSGSFGQAGSEDWNMQMDDWDEEDQDDEERAQGMAEMMGNMTSGGNDSSSGGEGGQHGGETNEEYAERLRMEQMAEKLYRMNPEERSKELFSGLVKSLCETAGRYVQHVRSFEQFYIDYIARKHREQEGGDH